MSSIHYKFKNSLDHDTLVFDGIHITLGELKRAIMAQKKMGKGLDLDLEITNAQTKKVYKDETCLIPKNSSVIVSKVPLGGSAVSRLKAVEDGSTGIGTSTAGTLSSMAPLRDNAAPGAGSASSTASALLATTVSTGGRCLAPLPPPPPLSHALVPHPVRERAMSGQVCGW